MTAHHMKFINIVKMLLLARADLTTATEIDHGRGWRLAATICYLRQRYGWPIETVLDHLRIAHYRLPVGWTPPSDSDKGRANAPSRTTKAKQPKGNTGGGK